MQFQDSFPAPAEEAASPRVLAADAVTSDVVPDMMMLAHIGIRGDVRAEVGSWVGDVGSGLPVEGILLFPPALGSPQLSPALDYQGLYGHDLTTPWIANGQPCGSAGLSLGLIGLRFRLSVESSPFFECRYDVSFIDGSIQEDVAGPMMARAASGACVEAIRLRLHARPPVPLLVLNDIGRRPPPEDEITVNDPSLRLRLLSPSFATRPPTIFNQELISDPIWDKMRNTFERGVFPPMPVSLRVLMGAYVVEEGIAFDQDLNAVAGTTRQVSEATVTAAQVRVAALRLQRDARRIGGLSVLCKSRAAANFGHYLVDMFPKAWLAQRLLPSERLTFIVHESDLLPVVRESLAQIGIAADAIVATGTAPVYCDSLLVLDGLTSPGQYQSRLCVQALIDLAQRLPAAPYPKLFVKRRARARSLINEAAIERILTARGFVAVDPGEMALTEQIVLFKGAKTVVGALGAAMTNIAFCAPGARVVALTSASDPDTCYWFLCQHLGHDYTEIRGADDQPDAALHKSWEGGFTIGEADFPLLETL